MLKFSNHTPTDLYHSPIVVHISNRIDFLTAVLEDADHEQWLYRLLYNKKDRPFDQTSIAFIKNQIKNSISMYEDLKSHLTKMEASNEKDESVLANFTYLYLTNVLYKIRYELNEHAILYGNQAQNDKLVGKLFQLFKNNNLLEFQVIPNILEEWVIPNVSPTLIQITETQICPPEPSNNFAFKLKVSTEDLQKKVEQERARCTTVRKKYYRFTELDSHPYVTKTAVDIFKKLLLNLSFVNVEPLSKVIEESKYFRFGETQACSNSAIVRNSNWQKIAKLAVDIQASFQKRNDLRQCIENFIQDTLSVTCTYRDFFYQITTIDDLITECSTISQNINNLVEKMKNDPLKAQVLFMSMQNMLKVQAAAQVSEQALSAFKLFETLSQNITLETFMQKVQEACQTIKQQIALHAQNMPLNQLIEDLDEALLGLDRASKLINAPDTKRKKRIPPKESPMVAAQNLLLTENKPSEDLDLEEQIMSLFDADEHAKVQRAISKAKKTEKIELRKQAKYTSKAKITHDEIDKLRTRYKTLLNNDDKNCLIKLFEPESKITFSEIEQIIRKIGYIDKSRNGSRMHFCIKDETQTDLLFDTEVLCIDSHESEKEESSKTKTLADVSFHQPKNTQDPVLRYIKKQTIEFLQRAKCDPHDLYPEHYLKPKLT